MKEKRTKNEILEDIDQEQEMCCINIFENLQANEITLTDAEILSFADEFYRKLHIQNAKVIVTGDGK
jgi:histidyl-tRNA synthetase